MQEKNKNANKAVWKPEMVKRYSSITDFDKFKEASLLYERKSIRVNTLKISVTELKKRLKDWKLEQVPWCKEGFFIEHKDQRRDIGNLLEHTLGYIYVQEASSMLPAVVLDPQPGDKVLDACAAPGSKTTQIAAMMKNKGIIVANEISTKRMQALGINLQRCGATNVVKTLMDASRLDGQQFDRILVDAPCSGLGTIRKSFSCLEDWNIKLITSLTNIQKGLINAAYRNLKKGGTVVYSTCTIEPIENEGIVDYVLSKYSDMQLQNIKLNIKRSPAVLEWENKKFNSEVKKCLRIYPQDNNTDGFFVAKFKKK